MKFTDTQKFDWVDGLSWPSNRLPPGKVVATYDEASKADVDIELLLDDKAPFDSPKKRVVDMKVGEVGRVSGTIWVKREK